MTLLSVGLFVAVVGGCDLLRAAADTVGRGRRLAILGAGAAVILAFLAWVGESWGQGLLLAAGLLLGLLLWVAGSSAALRPGVTARAAGRWRGVAFGGLVFGLVVAVLFAGALESSPAWPDALADSFFTRWPVSDTVVAAGAVLMQLATANLVVRLLLDAVGVPAATNEKKLKGGRLLGPMERVFIIGLGAIGEFTGAAIVVAAKGLLRFPELQAGAREKGPSDVSEYFLIGSFASWLIGLLGVAMIYLA